MNDKASALFTMSAALSNILGVFVGSGVLYQYLRVNTTMDIYVGLSLAMGTLFFLMNVWPGFLLRPKLVESIKTGYPSKEVRLSREVQEALDEKVEESRVIKSVRGSCMADFVFPVTSEQKMYLVGIDEEEEDENDENDDSHRP